EVAGRGDKNAGFGQSDWIWQWFLPIKVVQEAWLRPVSEHRRMCEHILRWKIRSRKRIFAKLERIDRAANFGIMACCEGKKWMSR
ncbi:MAG: hypothetical protein ACYSR5_04135, partial [Planctomycetota bacterium]